jgi:type IV pilus assembly protein PilF
MITTRTLLPGILLLLLCGCVSTTANVPAETDDKAAARQYAQLGARYFRNGNYEMARDRLLRAIELDPRSADAHMTLALTYEQLDNERLAEQHHNLAVRYGPRNFNVRNAYAVFLCGRKRYDDAREQFRQAAAIPDNDDPEISLTNAGVCMAQKPDNEQAESFFREALEERPSYGEALIQMASLKYRTEDYLQARAFMQRFLATNKATPDARYLAVRTESALDDERASEEYANQLLREFPESAQARRVLRDR